MTEIKSTLDLVMEKTKHLKLSAEEKAEMQLQDFMKKVPRYVERVLDHTLTPEQLLDEINTIPQELTDRARREVSGQMSQALDLTDKSDPLIPALEMLTEPAWSEMLAAIKRCRLKYKESRYEAQKEVRGRILGSLAAMGIRGSAVAAKVEGDPSWEAEDRRLRQPCEEKLEALRRALEPSQ